MHILASPGYAPGTIAVNVTRLERGFNACQTPRSIPHLCVAAPQGVTPLEFREDLDIHKTKKNGLSCGEEIMTIRSAFLIQYQRVTDGRTDGRTDRQTDRRTAYIYYVLQHIADSRKKTNKFKTYVLEAN